MKLAYIRDWNPLGMTTNPGQLTVQYTYIVFDEGHPRSPYENSGVIQSTMDVMPADLMAAITADLKQNCSDNFGIDLADSDVMTYNMTRMG